MQGKDILDKLSLKEKAILCSLKDCSNTNGIDNFDIDSINISNGSYGLCKINNSQDSTTTATCFPSPAAIACSWNNTLLYRMGVIIAEEALQEGVSVVLAPNLNIKRNPLAGGNFENYSEDPLLAGELGASFIQGLQSRGVSAAVKYFAFNNQQTNYYRLNSIVDERAMHELYLYGFEIAIKKGRPSSIITSCNMVNGIYATENKWLLEDLLYKKWGYRGLVISGYNAVSDIVKSIDAGLNIEMPFTFGYSTKKIMSALEDKTLSEEKLNDSTVKTLDFLINATNKKKDNFEYNQFLHHSFARKLAA